MNLIAALIGAATEGLVVRLGSGIASDRTEKPNAGTRAGGIVAGLTLAFAVALFPGCLGDGTRDHLKTAVLGVRAAFPDVKPQLSELLAEGELVAVRV